MSLALLCPGQGVQHAEMFERVRDLPAARHILDLASTVLGRDVFSAAGAEDRFDNAQAQPLLCAASLAQWQGLRDCVPAPTLIAGYSIGELAAHAIAGSFDAATCLALAAQRARLMDSASPADAGLQAVLGLERHVLQPLCDLHGAHVAIANGQDHFIVGGTHASLQRLADAARAQGADIRLLPVRVPAHTPLLAAAVAPFAAALDASPLQAPRLPLLAGIGDGAHAYFVHSYAAPLNTHTVAACDHGGLFTAVVEQGRYYGAQFHPERSGETGSLMLRNFLEGTAA